jgi:pyruvate dehydrogenase E2 component (dihydrolipoamide acetyltransferase)
MSTFNLPDLGEGLQEAEVVAWHVGEGDHVVVDQPLVSVETEKAVVEIPSPQSGHIARLLAQPGDRVKVGGALLSFEQGPHADSGAVVGELATPKPKPGPKPAVSGSPAAAVSGAIRAAPVVRARAKDLGVELASVPPSGPDGTITLADLESAAAAKPTARGATPLRGARRTMAENMARAWREVAHATVYDEVDIDGWFERRDVTSRLIRAIVAACAAEPSLNASFDAATASLKGNAAINLGIAIDSLDGLFVPVLHDVARAQPAEWRRQIDAIKKGVGERSLPPDRLRGATFTLSNFGTIAGRHAALIVMPPQVAILGAGRIVDRPARSERGLTMHRTLPLSLTFDHRAVTGGQAARFLRAAMDDLARPA